MSMKFKKDTKAKLADLEARVEALEEGDSQETTQQEPSGSQMVIQYGREKENH